MSIDDKHIENSVRLAHLISLKREGIALDEKQQHELEIWIRDGNMQTYEQLMDREWLIASLHDVQQFHDVDRMKDILSKTNVQQIDDVKFLPNETYSGKKKYNIRVWLRYAAILVPVIAISVAYLWKIDRSFDRRNRWSGSVPREISPASKRAILTLDDGTEISVETARSGVLGLQGNARVVKKSDGSLFYEVDHKVQSSPMVNTVKTPRGGFFELVLPDKSRVWLNASSSIRFPPAFSDSVRQVEISGELYFEVAQEKGRPFKVIINNDLHLEVLGTHFNVQAHPSERSIHTTLLEGSVKLMAVHGKAPTSITLKPPQGVVYEEAKDGQGNSASHSFRLQSRIDTTEVVAWKKGMFSFNDRSFESSMNEISRWYDVEVIYDKNKAYPELWGTMDRQIAFTKLVEFLNQAGIKCHQDERGRLVIVGE
jgi:transmembrane sensor